jgi:hypothetical protein
MKTLEDLARECAGEAARHLYPDGSNAATLIYHANLRFLAAAHAGPLKGVGEALVRAEGAMGKAYDVMEIIEDTSDSTMSRPAQSANAEIRSTLAVVRPALALLQSIQKPK